MGSVRKLIEMTPFLSKCKQAERFSKRNLLMFDYEIENPESEFAFQESDKNGNRIASAEIPGEYIGDTYIYGLCMSRLQMAALSSAKSKGQTTEEQDKQLVNLIETAETNEEVDSILSVQEASTMGVWDS